ncbi:MAG: protein kinase [Candidatus Competibacteraceae bacterium]|nr:protein kinase [Candidatus Competibacteraceae bacterium]
MTDQVMKIPGYTIVKKIGEGGMATVYLAVQESLGRQVALKVMRSARIQEENFAERFSKEGRLIAQLQHPQIITIYDFGSRDLYNYFSMEFLPGGTLAEQIEQGLSLERAVEMIRSVSIALAYAHKRGVIHRDLKPQNVLFRQDGTPVLSDFGIAKVVDSDDTQLTVPGFTVGSPVYMSPEQIMGKKLDSRADLYSLGIVFYEMLAKQPPFRSDDITSIAMMHCTQPVPQLPVGFGRLQPVLQKLLAKNPKDRFENAEQFIDALDHTATRPSFRALTETTQILQSLSGSFHSKKGLLIGGLSLLALVTGSLVYFTVSRQRWLMDTQIDAQPTPTTSDRPAGTTNYEQLALKYLEAGDFKQSLEWVKQGLNASPDDGRLLALRERVERQQEAARLLEQAWQNYREGQFEQSSQRVADGLRLAPDHEGLLKLQATLQTAVNSRQQQADQLFAQANARWQADELEGSLALIEQGLQQVANHPKLLNLRAIIESRIKERQLVPQLLVQAQELLRREEFDESLKRIEEGLSLISQQPDLLKLRDQVRTASATKQRVNELLRDCAVRFPLDRLSSKQGSELLACYQQITALSPDNAQVRARLEQIADRYANLANSAVNKADFQLAEDYLAQLEQIRPTDPRLVNLRQALQTKREQATRDARRTIDEQSKKRSVGEDKRQRSEETKRRSVQESAVKRTPDRSDSRVRPPAATVLKSEVTPSSKPSQPKPDVVAQPRQRGPKVNCREALLKAQLGEPLSATEQKECR